MYTNPWWWGTCTHLRKHVTSLLTALLYVHVAKKVQSTNGLLHNISANKSLDLIIACLFHFNIKMLLISPIDELYGDKAFRYIVKSVKVKTQETQSLYQYM